MHCYNIAFWADEIFKYVAISIPYYMVLATSTLLSNDTREILKKDVLDKMREHNPILNGANLSYDAIIQRLINYYLGRGTHDFKSWRCENGRK